ncbi:MAG: hypothetical protein WAR57_06380 [Candidatus Phosphoribacter sp.]|nr:hypothetical protein [Actinomycetales bacterium]
MSTSIHNTANTATAHESIAPYQGDRDLDVETRRGSKTTEFFVYLAAVAAIVITAFVVGDDGENTADLFNAEHALRYITFLTIGYMIARGLAKSGTRGNTRHNA